VVVAESTRKLVGNLFELEDLGAQDLKGISGPVRAWVAVRPSSAESRFEAFHVSGLTELVGREEELELLLWSARKRLSTYCSSAPRLLLGTLLRRRSARGRVLRRRLRCETRQPCLNGDPSAGEQVRRERTPLAHEPDLFIGPEITPGHVTAAALGPGTSASPTVTL
jgi:hypothetical protein